MGPGSWCFCLFFVLGAAIRDEDHETLQAGESAHHTHEDPEPNLDEVGEARPIPGSQTWYRTNYFSKNSHKCGANQYCCMRGCKYIVEQDACGDCEGHNVKQKAPREMVEEYQTTHRKFRIPLAIDKWPLRGCATRNSAYCLDKDQTKACCCDMGFTFDFELRQCVVDVQDPENKEEPIPGSEKWGLKKGANQKLWAKSSRRCVKDSKKWCCHRGCEYDINTDKCGKCKSYAESAVLSPMEVIKKFSSEQGIYVIPRSIDAPGTNILPGVGASVGRRCSTSGAKMCQASGASEQYCCCFEGTYFSFSSRSCVAPAQHAAEEQAVVEEAQAPIPQVQQPEPEADATSVRSRYARTAEDDRGAAPESFSLLALFLALVFF